MSQQKVVNREARSLFQEKKVAVTQECMLNLKKQLTHMEKEIDSISMPVIDQFKDTILK